MSDELNNQDIDITGAKPDARPVLAKQLRKVRLGDVGVNDGEFGRSVKVPMTLEEPAQDLKGNTINVGFPVTIFVDLAPKNDKKREMNKKLLVGLQCAALDRKEADGSIPWSECSGKEVLCGFGVFTPTRKDGETSDPEPRQVVDKFLPVRKQV